MDSGWKIFCFPVTRQYLGAGRKSESVRKGEQPTRPVDLRADDLLLACAQQGMAKSCSWWERWRAGSWLATTQSPQGSLHFFPEFRRTASASLRMDNGWPMPAIPRAHSGKANRTAASEFNSPTRRSPPCSRAGHPMASSSFSMVFCPAKSRSCTRSQPMAELRAKSCLKTPRNNMILLGRLTEQKLLSADLRLIATLPSGSSTSGRIKFRRCLAQRAFIRPAGRPMDATRRHAFRLPQPYAFRLCHSKVG